MAQEQMQRVRELIKAKKYDEARTLLKTINHPKAKEWLAKLDEMSPRSQPSTHDAAELLTKARQLIQSKQYDEARNLLEAIPDNPRAKQWLAKLDEIAPDDPFKNTTQQKSKNNQSTSKSKRELQNRGCLWASGASILIVVLFSPFAAIGNGWLSLLVLLVGGVIYIWKSSEGKSAKRLIQESGGYALVCFLIVAFINSYNPDFFDLSPNSSSNQSATIVAGIKATSSEAAQNSITGLIGDSTDLPTTPTNRPRATLPPTWTPTSDALNNTTPNTSNDSLGEDTGLWRIDRDNSSFDDTETVVLSLDAEDTIQAWLDEPLPTLVLRCRENEIDAYIVTGTQANVELDNNFVNRPTARFRFDTETAFTLKMIESTDGDALFFPDAPSIIRQMQQHERLLFGFTPFNASFSETSFELKGLLNIVQPLWDACN